MTTRQTIEIICLALVCVASVRAAFWKGEGFTQIKKLGLILGLIVFFALTVFILHH